MRKQWAKMPVCVPSSRNHSQHFVYSSYDMGFFPASPVSPSSCCLLVRIQKNLQGLQFSFECCRIPIHIGMASEQVVQSRTFVAVRGLRQELSVSITYALQPPHKCSSSATFNVENGLLTAIAQSLQNPFVLPSPFSCLQVHRFTVNLFKPRLKGFLCSCSKPAI